MKESTSMVVSAASEVLCAVELVELALLHRGDEDAFVWAVVERLSPAASAASSSLTELELLRLQSLLAYERVVAAAQRASQQREPQTLRGGPPQPLRLSEGGQVQAEDSATLEVGQVRVVGMLRFRRFRDSLRVVELVGAGKRGRRCTRLSVSLGERGEAQQGTFVAVMLGFGDLESLRGWLDESGSCYHITHERGVDVAPADWDDILVHGPDMTLRVQWDTWCLANTVDTSNQPRTIPGERALVRGVRMLHKRARELEGLTYHEVRRRLSEWEISMHSYCAMD